MYQQNRSPHLISAVSAPDRSSATDIPPATESQRLVTIQVAKEYLSFSAGHFTIFSATERERLHGHNFRVQAEVTAPVDDNGLTFDYVLLKRRLKALCDSLDERLLLPLHSAHLEIIQTDGLITARFDGQSMSFPEADVLLMPLRNVTVEELSHWFLQQLAADPALQDYDVQEITLSVSSGDGQWGTSRWARP